jgi:hypothetical protein
VLLGGAFGLAVITGGVLFASPGDASAAASGVGFIVLVLGAVLGAVFGPGAARPGLRSALLTSTWVTATAVPLGAIGVAASMFSGGPTVSTIDAIAATLAAAFVGLLFLGLPITALTYVVANIWVGLVRLAARLVLRSSTV